MVSYSFFPQNLYLNLVFSYSTNSKIIKKAKVFLFAYRDYLLSNSIFASFSSTNSTFAFIKVFIKNLFQ